MPCGLSSGQCHVQRGVGGSGERSYEGELSGQFGVNQKYRGTIEIVVPEASGTLALDPGALMGGPAGWEWTY
ncbi:MULTISPECIES: hypothetical protein [Prauserella salsuginis group]|uniref:Uncharacterized protein n=1 Tax=Prauserella salsuginis TaxID=387889 RepID=A0ABW6G9F1_9PSEU|nr:MULTISPECIES: hypothetical protein [Prauserella salsuginis group]MCR3721521.1 hypothetical protein [Prauserella flava]MCR3734213.1 hypothetical protein [Prauserella salsuginis]